MKHLLVVSVSLLTIGLSLCGCNSRDAQLRDDAQITGKAQADRQVEATNEDIERKVLRMKTDLEARIRLCEGVVGTYEGEFMLNHDDSEPTRVQFVITANFPPYHSDGIHTIEEVTADLTSVHLDILAKLLPPSHGQAIGKIYNGLLPDKQTGQINLFSSGEKTAYVLWLSSGSPIPAAGNSGARIVSASSGMAQALLTGFATSVPELWVDVISVHSEETYHVRAHRMSP